MPIITCPHCGTRYSYKEMPFQMRDEDFEYCAVCRNILLKWNGGDDYYDFEQILNSTFQLNEDND